MFSPTTPQLSSQTAWRKDKKQQEYQATYLFSHGDELRKNRTCSQVEGRGNDNLTPKGSGGAVQWVERRKRRGQRKDARREERMEGKRCTRLEFFFPPCVIGPWGGGY